MPKITVHGGASNAREAIDPARQPSAPAARETARDEADPNAPIARPGEGVFFAERADGPEEVTGNGSGEALPELKQDQSEQDEAPATPGDDQPEVAKVPARRPGAKRQGGVIK